MWKVFPKIFLLKLLFSIFAALFLGALILFLSPEETAISWKNFRSGFSMAIPVTYVFITVVFLLGKWGWLGLWKFPYLNKIMNRSVCPDLNGKWVGEIHSSFIDDDGKKTVKKVSLNIHADLFGFNLTLNSLDGYQDSKVVQSEIYKDQRTNTFYLYYIFEASVRLPEEADDRDFEGAAKLEIVFDHYDTILKGTYWTNRAWQRGMNTAGLITMRKKKQLTRS